MSNSDSENVDALRLVDQSMEPIKQITGLQSITASPQLAMRATKDLSLI